MIDDPDALLDGNLLTVLRRLECADPARPRLGGGVRLADEIVRLSQSVSLGFGGRSLVSLEAVPGPRPWRLHCLYPGLFGPSGPLPLHVTEEADRRARHHGDPTTREFIDRFNHRLLVLFYRAWADAEPAIAGDRPAENPFADMLGALGGHGEAASRGRDTLPDEVRQGSATWFGATTRSPDGLLALLRRHLGLDARVIELSGGWVRVPDDARLALHSAGRTRVRLGEGLLGRRGWCANGAFRLAVRTPTRAAFARLARAGRGLDTLSDLVRGYVGDELAWELVLEMPAAEARPVSLDRARRLGRDSWLVPPSRPPRTIATPCRLRLDEARRHRVRAAFACAPESGASATSADAVPASATPTRRITPEDRAQATSAPAVPPTERPA